MNHYELLALISGRFADNEVEPVFQKIESLVKKFECPIHYRQNLERKRLAYPIDHQLYGYYFLMEFDCEPLHIGKIDRELKLANDVLRHTLIKRKTVGKPKTAERKTSLEQEAFGKTFDRSKLGLDEVPHVAVAPDPAPAAPAVIDEHVVATRKEIKPKEKKIDDKVSFEELDKKLEDILKNDIL